MNFRNFTFITLCHPPTSPSDTFIFPNKSLLYFTAFCVCYLLSLTRVAWVNIDRRPFGEGWTRVQALHTEEGDSLSPDIITVNTWGRPHELFASCDEMWMDQSCAGLGKVTTAALSSGVQQPCWDLKNSTTSIPLTLSFFLSPLLKCFLNLGGGEADALFST